MRAPCEIMVKYYLPAVRAEVAKQLFASGYTQVEIAKILGTTQAAVSKYLSNKLDGNAKKIAEFAEVKKTAAKIAGNYKNIQKNINLICNTCERLRAEHKICTLHEGILPGIAHECVVCK